MSQELAETFASYVAPHERFNKQFPKVIRPQGIAVFDYIPEKRLDELVRGLSDAVDLRRFDIVYFNQKGGEWLKNRLVTIQKFKGTVLPCEYHPDGRVPVAISESHRGLTVGMIEDVRDTRRTTDLIRKDAPNTYMINVARKLRFDQVPDPMSIYAVDTDDVWLGGGGMNLETPGDGLPKDFLRDFPGIVVKIPQTVLEDGTWVY